MTYEEIQEIAGWLNKEHNNGGVEPFAVGAKKVVSSPELGELSKPALNLLKAYEMLINEGGCSSVVITNIFVSKYLKE